MGQKVHPSGFRLNTTQNHKSTWFTDLNNYPLLLKHDYYIRDYIYNKFELAGITSIEIERTYQLNYVMLNINVAKPGLIICESGLGLRELSTQLENRFSAINKFHINIIEIDNPFKYASLVAKFIASQLIRRVSFKRAVRKALEYSQEIDEIAGIKIQVSGRLNGAEIARSEWTKDGRMPLQTLRANIDYATTTAKTIYGILGIKVWLFKGESFI